jgi:tRNA pseudouridine38-40 synthase
MVLAYDGTEYHGWQAQPEQRTVAGELSRALVQLTSEKPLIEAAGRTDAGAHAHGQVVSFTLRSQWVPSSLAGGCNALLPADIGVLNADLVAADFHARFGAWRRTYRYLVRDQAVPDPVGRQYEWRIAQQLEQAPMRVAARALLGRHDFSRFGSSPSRGGSTVRTVDRAELDRRGKTLVLEVRADAFLKGMMRNFAAALVAVGTGRASAEDVQRAVLAGAQTPASRWETAPAHGLHQWQVDYRPVTSEVAA